jgi:hypothetical protein
VRHRFLGSSPLLHGPLQAINPFCYMPCVLGRLAPGRVSALVPLTATRTSRSSRRWVTDVCGQRTKLAQGRKNREQAEQAFHEMLAKATYRAGRPEARNLAVDSALSPQWREDKGGGKLRGSETIHAIALFHRAEAPHTAPSVPQQTQQAIRCPDDQQRLGRQQGAGIPIVVTDQDVRQ